MTFEVGTHLYRYTIRHNKFYIHEGIVNQCVNRKVVVFPNGGFNHGSVRCPRPEDIGSIHSNGYLVWLTERNDELAKRIFIEYEEGQINRMEKLLAEKKEVIKMLKED